MSFMSTQKTIESITAPIVKIVADLNALAERSALLASEKKQWVRDINAEIETATQDSEKATALSEKYSKLIS